MYQGTQAAIIPKFWIIKVVKYGLDTAEEWLKSYIQCPELFSIKCQNSFDDTKSLCIALAEMIYGILENPVQVFTHSKLEMHCPYSDSCT